MAVGEPASRATPDELLARLRQMARGRETLDVARVHFIGLSEVERAYGARWPGHKTRILDAAESFLRKRVGNTDMLVRSDGGFVVVLAGAGGPEAHAIAAQLTHGLNAFFTGQRGQAPTPRVAGAAHTVPAKELEASLRRAEPVAPAAMVEAAEGAGPVELDWRFEPVWDVRREALSYWFVTPFNKSNNMRFPGYRFENGAANAARLLKTDEAGLWVAEHALQALLSSGKQALIGTMIHAHSLTNMASRARLFATIDRLDPDLHRFRIIKIAGIAPGFPRLYLKEIVGALRSRLPHVVMSLRWDEPDVASLLQPGLSAIGMAAPSSGVMTGSIIAIPALMARINEAARLAHSNRMRLFVEGAVTKYLALKIAGAGGDNIASDTIWPARAEPDGIQSWSANHLSAA